MLTDTQKSQIADAVDSALALQGEDVDGPAARGACLHLLEQEEWQAYPATNKGGEQSTYIGRLALVVLSTIGQAAPEQKVHAIPNLEKWDDTGAPEARKPPLTY